MQINQWWHCSALRHPLSTFARLNVNFHICKQDREKQWRLLNTQNSLFQLSFCPSVCLFDWLAERQSRPSKSYQRLGIFFFFPFPPKPGQTNHPEKNSMDRSTRSSNTVAGLKVGANCWEREVMVVVALKVLKVIFTQRVKTRRLFAGK